MIMAGGKRRENGVRRGGRKGGRRGCVRYGISHCIRVTTRSGEACHRQDLSRMSSRDPRTRVCARFTRTHDDDDDDYARTADRVYARAPRERERECCFSILSSSFRRVSFALGGEAESAFSNLFFFLIKRPINKTASTSIQKKASSPFLENYVIE